MNELYYLDHARTKEQRDRMIQLEKDGICLFCEDNLRADPEQPLLYESDTWIVTPNRFPYKGTTYHLLMIPKEHIADMIDLSLTSQSGFWGALSWIREQYNLTYYGLGARNGSSRYTGGTIAHVHIHVIVGDPDISANTPVRFKLSS